MSLELSLIAGELARYAVHQTRPAAGAAANAAQRARMVALAENMGTIVETKNSSHASRAGRKLRNCRAPTITSLSAQ